MSRTAIQNATDRLRVLVIDTNCQCGRDCRRLTPQENMDVDAILDELHRLHQAVSEQRAALEAKAAIEHHPGKKRAHK